jgi:hypothetical protein
MMRVAATPSISGSGEGGIEAIACRHPPAPPRPTRPPRSRWTRVDSEGGDARVNPRRLSALAASSHEPLRIDLAVREWARHGLLLAVDRQPLHRRRLRRSPPRGRTKAGPEATRGLVAHRQRRSPAPAPARSSSDAPNGNHRRRLWPAGDWQTVADPRGCTLGRQSNGQPTESEDVLVRQPASSGPATGRAHVVSGPADLRCVSSRRGPRRTRARPGHRYSRRLRRSQQRACRACHAGRPVRHFGSGGATAATRRSASNYGRWPGHGPDRRRLQRD